MNQRDRLIELLKKVEWQYIHETILTENVADYLLDNGVIILPTDDVQEVKHGKWEVRHRHEHYPSGKPYDENVCPFCNRADHNGDGIFCGYCGAKMEADGK